MRQSIVSLPTSQDGYGNTAGHLAVLHFNNGKMLTFLEGLYSKGFGRCDTETLYAAQHAQHARGVALFLNTSTRVQADLQLFSTAPGHVWTSVDAHATTVTPSIGAHDFNSIERPSVIRPRVFEAQYKRLCFADALHDVDCQSPDRPHRNGNILLLLFDLAFAAPARTSTSGLQLPSSCLQPTPRTQVVSAEAGKDFIKHLQDAAVRQPDAGDGHVNTSDAWATLTSTIKKRTLGTLPRHHASGPTRPDEIAGLAFIEEYAAALAVDLRPRLLDLLNGAGLTPFTLAGQEGKRAIVEAMWDESRKLMWSWGGFEAYTYPLDQVDDIGQVSSVISLCSFSRYERIHLHCMLSGVRRATELASTEY